MNTHFTKAIMLMLGAAMLLSCQPTSPSAGESEAACIIAEGTYAGLPFEMERVQQPSFPDYKVSIADFGATPDGITLNTDAINVKP